jgi:D-glycero-alpha-D-manno-heptose-7-phosphate kinase
MYVLSRTPVRISFFGGGTDLPGYYCRHGGSVLSFAIGLYVYVTVKDSWDDDIVVRCEGLERASSIDDIAHPIVRECLRVTGWTGGVEVISSAELPSTGSGLGSSSAFTVGLLHALVTAQGRAIDPAGLAELACEVEIGRLGEPIGKQDQYAAATGGCHEYRFAPDGTVTATAVDLAAFALEELHRHAMLIYSGEARKAGDVLRDQQSRAAANESVLHLLKDQVQQGRELLRDGDVEALGRLLDAAWVNKKLLSNRINTPKIDSAYRVACEAGAYGGKIAGAGGGGFLFLLCPPQRQAAVMTALGGLRRVPVRLGVGGTEILATS